MTKKIKSGGRNLLELKYSSNEMNGIFSFKSYKIYQTMITNYMIIPYIPRTFKFAR